MTKQTTPLADVEEEQCDAFQPNILGVPEPEDRCVKAKGHEGKHSRIDGKPKQTAPLTDRAEQNTSREMQTNTPPANVERSLLPTQESDLPPCLHCNQELFQARDGVWLHNRAGGGDKAYCHLIATPRSSDASVRGLSDAKCVYCEQVTNLCELHRHTQRSGVVNSGDSSGSVASSLQHEIERFALSGQCDNGAHSNCPYPERCKCACHASESESSISSTNSSELEAVAISVGKLEDKNSGR